MKKFIKMAVVASLFPLTAISTENMSFHGTLIAPPCKISSDKTIEVAFGKNLGVTKIDGSNYMQSVKYTVDCEAGYTANNLAIIVDTTLIAAFDDSAVKTNKEGLGIRIIVDGQPVTFAKRVAVTDPASPPIIQAVPVQDPGVTLTEGVFEATMTLRADYM